jgi:hypothetical protein
MTLDEWIISDDTGISSKTIWAALKGVKIDNVKSTRFDYPYDNADFGRCYRLVKNCGVTKEQLLEVKEVFKWLTPLIDAWDELSKLWEKKDEASIKLLYKKLSEELRPKMSKLKCDDAISMGKGITISF